MPMADTVSLMMVKLAVAGTQRSCIKSKDAEAARAVDKPWANATEITLFELQDFEGHSYPFFIAIELHCLVFTTRKKTSV